MDSTNAADSSDMRKSLYLALLSLGFLGAAILDADWLKSGNGFFGDRRDVIHVVTLLIFSLAVALCLLKDRIAKAKRSN
jgi:hypothetical protein